jgi:8-oxo-dGTP diphosphatase
MSTIDTPDDLSADAAGAVAAVSVAVVEGDAVLLVKRGREPSKGLWAFPGGRVEPGESDEQAAIREVFEETGLAVSDLTPFQAVTIVGERDGAPVRYRLKVFTAHAFSGTPVAGDDAEKVGWFRLADLDGLPMARSMAEGARAVLSTAR